MPTIKLHIGDIPTQKQIEREIFDIKMLMLQTENPQEQRRLSNAIKVLIKLINK